MLHDTCFNIDFRIELTPMRCDSMILILTSVMF